jgi:hypothetical protein
VDLPFILTGLSIMVSRVGSSFFFWPFVCLLWRNVYSSPLPNTFERVLFVSLFLFF